ncbi:ANK_REP_REGION domain-containing protein [Caerostris darwini]|uniref:ANK_REP_REGION domain-containing protein n=1 Tax=Caerostris darwini TaxID=1538125 RepID=A0AAV4SS41_9ARAC|nr:ANK_REP_REGION domain-containing protein [Caerostris darwini]
MDKPFRKAAPLHCLLTRGGGENYELIREMIQKGADVNDANNDLNITPLHQAVLGCVKDIRVINLLLQNGAHLHPEFSEVIYAYLEFETFFIDKSFNTSDEIECVKLLIKYQFLKNSHLVERSGEMKTSSENREENYYEKYNPITECNFKPSSYYSLRSFLDECSVEICRMEKAVRSRRLSLLKIVTTKNSLHKVKNPEKRQKITNKIVEECAKHHYPVYKDLIAERLERENLLNNLNNKLVITISNKNKVSGRLDLLYKVEKYLNNLDLLNVAIAFI